MRTAGWALAGVVFVILATANAAGYRYGVSDQAFYIPVVTRAMDPAAFPHDAGLIDAQGRLMAADEALAGVAAATGAPLDTLFLAGYILSLAVIWAALVRIGTRVYSSPWLVVALGAAFTLRHQIPRTSANSFEPYFHPRMLAFGIGLLAIGAVLRRQSVLAVALVCLAAIVHVTTGAWFAVMTGVALAILDVRMRRFAAAVAVVVLVGAAGSPGSPGFEPSFAAMDPLWLQALAGKDTLFPSDWPAWAWIANLGLLAALWGAYVARARRGCAIAADRGLVWGATALVGLFLATLPLVAMRLTLPVQLQISRVFWLVDVVALVYLLSLADVAAGAPAAPSSAPARRRAPVILAALLVTVSAARGAYIMTVERPERALFAVHLPRSSWGDAMRWLAAQPMDTHVLADPAHAWKYGTSVRVSAGRDVLLEEVKDAALAIYSREVAQRVVERAGAVGDFGSLTAPRARQLARQYDLDFLVTDARLPLERAYRNDRFTIYKLR